MSKTFSQRLTACQKGGNLTVADLQRWFDRPYPTVRSWLIDNREPSGGPQDRADAVALLGKLEALIKGRKGFPIPRLPQAERIEHLQKIRIATI